jgi:hypothetical protein
MRRFLEGGRRRLTGALDVDEVDVVRGGVDHGPEGHRVGDLPMEPDVLVGGEQPSQLGAHDADDVAEHWEEDEGAVEGQDEARTTGDPDRKLERVEAAQTRVCFLRRRIFIDRHAFACEPKDLPG